MKSMSAESIYSKIMLLSDIERDKLYNRMRENFYQNVEIVAYTTTGAPLTRQQYRDKVNAGIEQCMTGKSISLEDLSKELGYNYADL
jgi:hypothetical protein